VAILLRLFAVIVRRDGFARCHSLPEILHRLNPEGGFVGYTVWYDRNLFCETVVNPDDADDILRRWKEKGLAGPSPDGSVSCWKDVCVASSGHGPITPCDWLEYDPETDSVWLKGTEKGDVIGGRGQADWNLGLLPKFLARAEQCYTDMYDASTPKDHYEDACESMIRALRLARFLHLDDAADRIERRLEHIRAVYDSQFR
jgi:hypothetical protein